MLSNDSSDEVNAYESNAGIDDYVYGVVLQGFVDALE